MFALFKWYDYKYCLRWVLYVIAFDPETTTIIQGVGFSFREPSSFHIQSLLFSIYVSISTKLFIKWTFGCLVDEHLQILLNINSAFQIIIIPCRTSILWKKTTLKSTDIPCKYLIPNFFNNTQQNFTLLLYIGMIWLSGGSMSAGCKLNKKLFLFPEKNAKGKKPSRVL